MRHAAASYVVVSFNTETVYRVLAARARQLGYHALVPGLDAAAGHADDSRRAWLAVAHVWDNMVTDTRGYLSRPAAEAGHLALWTGRLAYADPAWTPARSPSHAVRDPASLAPGPAELTEIASAMHYTADSLARAARTELDTVAAAGTAGRLYVTTRSLPAHYDVPRPYADAPRDRIADALAVYADAADTSQAMLRSAGDVAAAVDAPSLVLSAAEPGDGPPGGRATRPPRAAPARPGRSRCRAAAPGRRTGPAGTAGTGPGSPRRAESARSRTPRFHPNRTPPTRQPRSPGPLRRPLTSRKLTARKLSPPSRDGMRHSEVADPSNWPVLRFKASALRADANREDIRGGSFDKKKRSKKRCVIMNFPSHADTVLW